MSIRESLRKKVACCVPLDAQHATFQEVSATDTATSAQQNTANPHEIGVSCATGTATSAQQGLKRGATFDDSDEKLRVAFASTRNTQLFSLTAKRQVKELIAAAMRACDHHGDNEAARAQMRADVQAIPPHLQDDLLQHFESAYPRKARP